MPILLMIKYKIYNLLKLFDDLLTNKNNFSKNFYFSNALSLPYKKVNSLFSL